MFRKALLWLLALFVSTASFAQEPQRKKAPRNGEAAGYSSRDATVLSMIGWGTVLAVGIATLCALLNDGTGTTSD